MVKDAEEQNWKPPVRIVAKKDIPSIAISTLLLKSLHHSSKPATLRIIEEYNTENLTPISNEEYNTYIFIECDEKDKIKDKNFQNTIFIDIGEGYEKAKSISPKSKNYSFLQVLAWARTENPKFNIDEPLSHALKSGRINPQNLQGMEEITPKFIEELKIKIDGKEIQISRLLGGVRNSIKTGNTHQAVNTLLEDPNALSSALEL